MIFFIIVRYFCLDSALSADLNVVSMGVSLEFISFTLTTSSWTVLRVSFHSAGGSWIGH